MIRWSWCVAVLAGGLWMSGCATGNPAPPEEDADMSAPADMGQDMGPADMPADMSTPADMPPDLPPDMNMCPVCCAGDTMCQDGDTLATCNADGTGYDTAPCGADNICDLAANKCAPKPVCTPNESSCVDSSTRLVCRASGTGYSTVSCPENTTCQSGQCVSGAPNGTTCADASECAGGKCQCGAGESCNASQSPAYCTATCANSAQCSSTEWCLNSDVRRLPNSQVANYHHCVERCQTGCSTPGMACKETPILDEQGNPGWARACVWQAFKGIGESCTSDSECIGGVCLTGYFDTGLCTSPCEVQGCPELHACVKLGSGQQHLCSPMCGDGSAGSTANCPLDPDGNRFDVDCALRTVHSGGARRVCVSP